jgi:hypothetical protein
MSTFKTGQQWPQEIPIDPMYKIDSFVIPYKQIGFVESQVWRTTIIEPLFFDAKSKGKLPFLLVKVYENSQGKIPKIRGILNGKNVYEEFVALFYLTS